MPVWIKLQYHLPKKAYQMRDRIVGNFSGYIYDFEGDRVVMSKVNYLLKAGGRITTLHLLTINKECMRLELAKVIVTTALAIC